MTITKSSKLTPAQKQSLLTIWNKVYPIHLTYVSINELDNYLTQLVNPSHYIATENNKLIGWLSVFDRDDGRWVVLIIDEHYHGKGIGNKLLDSAKKNEVELNGWVIDHNNDLKIDSTPYLSPLTFYLKNGFQNLNERLNTGQLSAIRVQWSK